MPYDLRWDNPKYWRRRAEEARTIAETMRNLEARVGMLRLAADYDAMAQRAENAQICSALKSAQAAYKGC